MSDEPTPITVRWQLRFPRFHGDPEGPIAYVEQSARYANESCPLMFVGPENVVAKARAAISRAKTGLWYPLNAANWTEPLDVKFAMQQDWLAKQHGAELLAGAELFDRPMPEEKPFHYELDQFLDAAANVLAQLHDALPPTDRGDLYGNAYVVHESMRFVSLDEAVALVTRAQPEWEPAVVRGALLAVREMDDDTMDDLERFRARIRGGEK